MHLLLNGITRNIGKSVPILYTFVDLTKAFDTVSHIPLLELLEKIGFRGVTIALIQSYLPHR